MTLEFINLGIGFDQKLLFCGLNASLLAGESLAIMGCNGAGKSSLLKTLALRKKPQSGKILFNKRDIEASDIGYLPQSSNIISDIGISAGEFVNLSLKSNISKQEVIRVFNQYELEDIIDTPLNELSGGQLNRLQIVRIELQNPQILLFDEPFAYLDNASRNILIKKISEWKIQGKIIIVSVHDERLALEFDHFLTLDGKNALWEQKMKAHNKDCALAGCALVG
jgi:ABC-type Mn2+/Zn2+ transport system ATPase subunit